MSRTRDTAMAVALGLAASLYALGWHAPLEALERWANNTPRRRSQ